MAWRLLAEQGGRLIEDMRNAGVDVPSLCDPI
jgi:hypothetical protein